jgi:hypothetical protein
LTIDKQINKKEDTPTKKRLTEFVDHERILMVDLELEIEQLLPFHSLHPVLIILELPIFIIGTSDQSFKIS